MTTDEEHPADVLHDAYLAAYDALGPLPELTIRRGAFTTAGPAPTPPAGDVLTRAAQAAYNAHHHDRLRTGDIHTWAQATGLEPPPAHHDPQRAAITTIPASYTAHTLNTWRNVAQAVLDTLRDTDADYSWGCTLNRHQHCNDRTCQCPCHQ